MPSSNGWVSKAAANSSRRRARRLSMIIMASCLSSGPKSDTAAPRRKLRAQAEFLLGWAPPIISVPGGHSLIFQADCAWQLTRQPANPSLLFAQVSVRACACAAKIRDAGTRKACVGRLVWPRTPRIGRPSGLGRYVRVHVRPASGLTTADLGAKEGARILLRPRPGLALSSARLHRRRDCYIKIHGRIRGRPLPVPDCRTVKGRPEAAAGGRRSVAASQCALLFGASMPFPRTL